MLGFYFLENSLVMWDIYYLAIYDLLFDRLLIYYLVIYHLLFGYLPIVVQKKKETLKTQNLLWDWLSHEDSNLDRQYQKL